MKRPLPIQTTLVYQKIPYIIVGFSIFIVFFNSLSGSFLWDDQQFVLENKFLTSWEFLPRLFSENLVAGSGINSNLYRPIELVTHFFDLLIWGRDPFGHHLTNVLLAVILGLSFYSLTRSLLASLAPHKATVSAIIGTLLFSLHPLQSEAVAYVSGRGDLLMLICMIQAAIWINHSLFLAAVFCVLGTLSKESGALIPFFVLGIDWIRSSKTRINKKSHLVLVALSALYVLLRLTILNFKDIFNFYSTSNALTEHPEFRIFTFLSTFPKIIQLLFWPNDLHPGRHWPVFSDPGEGFVLAGFFILFMICISVPYLLKKKQTLASFGLAWFFLATLPTSNLVFLINAILYDHWLISPGLGMTLAASSLIALSGKWVTILSAGVLLPLSSITYKMNQTWNSPISLNQRILQFEPNSTVAMNNLAMAYAELKDFEKAEPLYLRSIQLNGNFAQTHHNLGHLYLDQGKEPAAIEAFHKALAIDPRLYQSHTWLGILYLRRGERKKAFAEFERSLQIHPTEAAETGLRSSQ